MRSLFRTLIVSFAVGLGSVLAIVAVPVVGLDGRQ